MQHYLLNDVVGVQTRSLTLYSDRHGFRSRPVNVFFLSSSEYTNFIISVVLYAGATQLLSPRGSDNSFVFSVLCRPMRSVASCITTCIHAGHEARAREGGPDNESSGSALSLRSSLSENGTSYLTTPDDSDDVDDEFDSPPHTPASERLPIAKHFEFGHCLNEAYRYTSAYKTGTAHIPHLEEEPPYYIVITTYLTYILVILLGHTRDFVGKRICPEAYRHLIPSNVSQEASGPPQMHAFTVSLRMNEAVDIPSLRAMQRSTRTLIRFIRDASRPAWTIAFPALSQECLDVLSLCLTARLRTTTPHFT
jgi:hypothetical protein